MNLPTENQNPFMRNIMEQVVSNVISMEEVKNKKQVSKEKSIFGDIPNTPKSSVEINEEILSEDSSRFGVINRTLLILYYNLNRINKFSVRELKEGGDVVCDEYENSVFDIFYIGGTKTRTECRFTYDGVNKCINLHSKLFDGSNLHGKFEYDGYIGFLKKSIKTKLDRMKISIWLCQSIFSYFGTETGIKDYSQMMDRFSKYKPL